MKKWIMILSLAILLTGCGKKNITGEVLSVSSEGQYAQLILQTEEGKQIQILADGHTHVYSFAAIEEGLLSGELINPVITAYDLKRQNGGYLADRICVESVELPQKYPLPDGTGLTVRKDYNFTIYIAPDGTEILREQDPIGPENVSVGGIPSLDTLPDNTQTAILFYYEALGSRYDLDAELERAYQWYLESDSENPFYSCMLSQDISPTAANNRLVWYAAYTTTPADGKTHHQTQLNTVFDRQTGAVVDPADLFTCSESVSIEALLDASGMPDTELRQEMEKNFSFDYLTFESNTLGVCFPAGSLMGHPSGSYMLGIRYEDISHILHPWAIPDSIE